MFSPRSPNYERLEGGMGASRLGGGRFFAWRKFALAAVVLIGLVWAFGPRKVDWLPEKYMPSLSRPDLSEIDYAPPPPPPEAPPKNRPQAGERPSEKVDETVKAPTGPSDDPDLSKTVHCTAPHSPSQPLVQYALMIDAGSTGSRIHIYKFNNCGPAPAYEYEVFRMTQPGLSAYKGRPLDAAQSLDVLLDAALEVVPPALRACTPVAVKATAGLRLLGAPESAAILDAVRARLHVQYPFSVQDADGVVIMDGKDEGVYAWITANYLLGTIPAAPAGTASYAVLDLGGASTQIVFEPTFDSAKPDAALEAGEHKYDLAFGGRTRVLYQHSYLGYGLMRARMSVHRLVEFMGSLRGSGSGPDARIANPCLARGTEKRIEIEDERFDYDRWNVTMAGEDVGSFDSCNRVVELVMAKDAICEVKPCSFNGVYQPSLLETFPSGKVLLLSYFYDRLQPFLATPALAGKPASVSTFATLAEQVCLGRSSWTTHFGGSPDLLEELEGRPEWCLDLTFMHALLRLGYELGGEREVELGKQIKGTELGWCLGATLAMVGAELKCRA
ncbi:nucleoside phosphatase family-domain-containing protein [Amylocystis lapponica]|nr:nucleoside phosphatase family-domain-containing protein [Amylocystis lapponica]